MPGFAGRAVEIDIDYVLHRLRIDGVQSARNRQYPEALQAGLYPGVPMSPGETAGWDIQDRRTIHSILECELTGVTITESCLLIPKNSVSFLAGLSDHHVKREGDTHCNYCSMREKCLYRSDRRRSLEDRD